MMSLYEGAKTESDWILICQRSLRLKLECTKDLCCHLVFLSETVKGLRHKFLRWKKAFESSGLKVDLGKTSDDQLMNYKK